MGKKLPHINATDMIMCICMYVIWLAIQLIIILVDE